MRPLSLIWLHEQVSSTSCVGAISSCFQRVNWLTYTKLFSYTTGLSIVPVTTMEHQSFDETNSIPPEAYYPNRASLDAAVEQSVMDGVVPRILLLSHPQNPLGICYPPEVVKEIIDWCIFYINKVILRNFLLKFSENLNRIKT